MELAIALAHRATIGEALTPTGLDPANFFIASASLEGFVEGSFSLFTGGGTRSGVAFGTAGIEDEDEALSCTPRASGFR